MSRVLDGLGWLVTVQPLITILVLLAVTIVLGAGLTRLAPQASDTIFLPKDSTVATASDEIEVVFGDLAPTVTLTLLFRGQPHWGPATLHRCRRRLLTPPPRGIPPSRSWWAWIRTAPGVAAAYVQLHRIEDGQRLEATELALRDIAQGSSQPAGGK